MIEITGLPAILALLAPFFVLAIVIARLYRRSPPPERAPEGKHEMLRATYSDRPLADPPSGEASGAGAAGGRGQPVDWALRIRSAEAGNDHAALAGLHLSAAR